MVHLRRRLAAYIRHKRAGVTQRAFARKTGVAQSTIMRIENEDQNVTLDTLEQFCKAFNVDVGDLFPAHQGRARDYQEPSVSSKIQPSMVHEHTKKVSGHPESTGSAKSTRVKSKPPAQSESGTSDKPLG
jgi:transcriptional regulator with XRE-family HTH domain